MVDQLHPGVPTRRPLPKKVRFDVFKRDRFRCSYCGRTPPDVLLEVDHVVPACDGGDDVEANLTTACFDCNRGKGGTPLTAIPQSLADRGAAIEEREEQLAGYRAIVQAQVDRVEEDVWRVAFVLYPALKTLKRARFLSIKNFVRLLPYHVLVEAGEKAFVRQPDDEVARFKYFCGICWNIIKDKEAA